MELAFLFEGLQIENEAYFGGIGHLVNTVFPDDDAFAEIRLRQIALLQNLAGLELHLTDRRLVLLSGALIEHAVMEDQAFGKCVAVVRVRVHDGVPILRNACLRLGGRTAGAGRQHYCNNQNSHLIARVPRNESTLLHRMVTPDRTGKTRTDGKDMTVRAPD